jgi:hypothetical protein
MDDQDYDLGWRRSAARAWTTSGTSAFDRDMKPSRTLSIFDRIVSLVPRLLCYVRDHKRGIVSIEDGRIMEIRGPTMYLRCRFCGNISPGWGIEFKARH